MCLDYYETEVPAEAPTLSMQSSVATEDYAMAASTSDPATRPGFTSMNSLQAEALCSPHTCIGIGIETHIHMIIERGEGAAD